MRVFNHFILSIFFIGFFLSASQFSYGASIYLEWDANTEEKLSGYKVYYRISSANYGEPVDVGNVTTYKLSALTEDETYFIALTAYGTFDDESEKSDEVTAIAQSTEEEQNTCDDPHKLMPVSLTTSSESLFWSEDNAIDGDPLTFWSSAVKFFWKNEFIILDLGETKQINSIDMHGTQLFGIDYFPSSFQIQISRDTINWVEIINEKSYDIQSSNTNNSWDFDTPEARYIRVYITKAKTFFVFHLVQIAEIEVFGCDMPEQKLVLPDENIAGKFGIKTIGSVNNEAENFEESHQRRPSVPGKPVVTFR